MTSRPPTPKCNLIIKLRTRRAKAIFFFIYLSSKPHLSLFSSSTKLVKHDIALDDHGNAISSQKNSIVTISWRLGTKSESTLGMMHTRLCGDRKGERIDGGSRCACSQGSMGERKNAIIAYLVRPLTCTLKVTPVVISDSLFQSEQNLSLSHTHMKP